MTEFAHAGAAVLLPAVDTFLSESWPLETSRCKAAAASLGWSVAAELEHGIDFRTPWSGDYPPVATLTDGGSTTEILLRVTNGLQPWSEPDLAVAFQSVLRELTPSLGQPDLLTVRAACWEVETGGRVWLKSLESAASIILLILSPDYATIERAEESAA